MTDERQSGLLFESWLKGTDPTPPDASRSVARVMDKVPQVRQRGRWWPLPAFDRPVSTFPGWELAPAPIPATNGRQPARGFTMLSAVKFVVAGVIVSLFGGFLLAGILTTPQGDEVVPAAVTESPSPLTTEDLLSGMVTEEVDPGVFRIVNDGVRDLSYPVEFRLGEEPVFEDPLTSPPYREVAPDGSLWSLGPVADDRSGISSFDGDRWTVRATTTDGLSALAVGPDGTVWVVAEDHNKHCSDVEDDACYGTVLLRLEDDGSLTTIEDWADVHDGEAAWHHLAVSPDGDVWLVGAQRVTAVSEGKAEVLLRFDGEGWEAIPGPEGWNPGDMGRYFDVGPDGALWVKTHETGGLARFDDRGWTTLTEPDGLQRWGDTGFSLTDLISVAADGSLWLTGSPAEPGGGVTRYHGTTTSSYLVGSCINDLATAPDGRVWLGANDCVGGPIHTYVIAPEATEPPSVEEATVTDRATKTTDLLSGMVTEEVEPGVYRVVNDGVRDHSYPEGGWGVPVLEVDVLPDGSVWLSHGVVEPGDLYHLGEEPEFVDIAAGSLYREVAPDGTLWAIGDAVYDPRGIFSFDGERWTERATATDDLSALAVGPDGSVWVAADDADKHCPDIEADACSGTTLLRLEDDGSLATIEDWADVYDGDATWPQQLAVSPNGDLWLVGMVRVLLHYDGEGWEAIPGPDGWDPGMRGRSLEFAPDGTMWMKVNGAGDLARFDDPGWTTYTKADGVQPWGQTDWGSMDVLDIAADGSLWLLGSPAEDGSGGGVAHYHDTTWTTYLADHYIHDFDIAPDGGVWVGANLYRWEPDDETTTKGSVGLYVITPEAVAGREQ
ncbi:MAG: hypothetical protein PVH07_11995 [Chloroflexota bacterium]|jgi:hypothetical protein